mgnify:CR=1 FL=1
MLAEQAEELDATLVTYGCALERYMQRGEHTQARRVRGLIRNAERERRSVQQMIAGLLDRFESAAHDRTDPRRTAMPPARPAARVHPYPSPHRVIRA